MRYASAGSAVASTVIERCPSARAAAMRWRPFGLRKPSRPAMAMTGSRNAPVSRIAFASRSAWVRDRSRWKSVASTEPIGTDASTSDVPPYGSL